MINDAAHTAGMTLPVEPLPSDLVLGFDAATKVDYLECGRVETVLESRPYPSATQPPAGRFELLGRPVVIDPNVADAALSVKSVVFGDFSAYYVRFAGPVRIERSDDYAFVNDLATFKFVMRADGDLVDTTGAIKHYLGAAS